MTKRIRRSPVDPIVQDRVRGCLLGGAVGDALGAPVEFMRRSEIVARFGESGIRDYVPAYGRLGAITDDTQMSLFTAEGMLRGWVRFRLKGIGPVFANVTAYAYLRWLKTQGYAPQPDAHVGEEGWLMGHKELFSRRAPGTTCVSALRSLTRFKWRAANDSKGCGGVMRSAPVGIFLSRFGMADRTCVKETFQVASDIAAITHGHPTGYLAAGAHAVAVASLLRGASLPEALASAKNQLRLHKGHEETTLTIELAEQLARSEPNSPAAVQRIGQGWIAEEALGISVYCALCAKDFEDGVVLSVNHDGDSDSTGAIAGNLLGCLHGASRIPKRWLEPLELRDVIEEIADDLATAREWDVGRYSTKYPPN